MDHSLNLPTIRTLRHLECPTLNHKTRTNLFCSDRNQFRYRQQQSTELSISSQITMLQKSCESSRFTYSKQRIKQMYRLNMYNNLSTVYKHHKIREIQDEKRGRIEHLVDLIPEDYHRVIRKRKKEIMRTQVVEQEKHLNLSHQISQKSTQIRGLIKEKENIGANKMKLKQEAELMKQYSILIKQVGLDTCEKEGWQEEKRCRFIVERLERMEDSLVNEMSQLQRDLEKNRILIGQRNSINRHLKQIKIGLISKKNKLAEQLDRIEREIENLSKTEDRGTPPEYSSPLAQCLKEYPIRKGKPLSMIEIMKLIQHDAEEIISTLEKSKAEDARLFKKLSSELALRRQKQREKQIGTKLSQQRT